MLRISACSLSLLGYHYPPFYRIVGLGTPMTVEARAFGGSAMASWLRVKHLAFPSRRANSQQLHGVSASDNAVEIEAEQTRLLYAQAPTGFVVTLLNASIVTVVLWQEIGPPVLLTWLALMVAV